MPRESIRFLHRFLIHILLAWIFPPLFVLLFLQNFGIFQKDQVWQVVFSPMQSLFLFGSLLFALIYFRLFARPFVAYLDNNRETDEFLVILHLRRFTTTFWSIFMLYFILAPLLIIFNAEQTLGASLDTFDWFRIHIVTLVIAVIIGLPIFFSIFDLFGKMLGSVQLQRPVMTVKTRVFLIGALVPLLITTLLVQHFWDRTQFFSSETVYIWMLLELLAIAGALILVRSFTQALYPLQTLIQTPRRPGQNLSDSLVSTSTDELGKLSQDIRLPLEEQQVHRERLLLTNRLLNCDKDDLGRQFDQILQRTKELVGCDIALLALMDDSREVLRCVAYTGASYQADGHYRVEPFEEFLLPNLFHNEQACRLEENSLIDRLAPPDTSDLPVLSAAAAPLTKGELLVGILACLFYRRTSRVGTHQLNILQAFAQEATLTHTLARDYRRRRRVEEAITKIVSGVSTATGEAFFPVVAKNMADIIKADLVAIGTFPPDRRDQVETLAFCLDGKSRDSFSYDLEGTPCQRVIGQQVRSYPSRVAEYFPEGDVFDQFREMSAYVGVPLFNSRKEPVGVQYAMFRQPLENEEFTESILRIFAARTSAEIERIAIENHFKHLAYYDTLTGLPNRDLLTDRMQQAVAHSRRNDVSLAVMMLDLDNFKSINDSLGHPVGDKLLAEIAVRLTRCIRAEDTIARLGGDEFVVLLTEMGDKESSTRRAVNVAEKIRSQLLPPYHIEGNELMLTLSIGIALYPDNGETPDELLTRADTALYQAKASGRNCHCFYSEEMNKSAIERLEMAIALREALREERFTLMFQPKLQVEDNRLSGIEALIRWDHPTQGMIPPSRFIAVAEETGQLIEIGNWVMQRTGESIREMSRSKEITVSFNVSLRQFQHISFVEKLEEMLRSTGIAPRLLELELTENVLIRDMRGVEEKLQRLKELGVRISIDDFGTGYSSLRYLQQLPIDSIKIDRTFIRNIIRNRNDAIIVETIIDMAKHLGIHTVAEGVETVEQLEILKGFGCEFYQGYLFSRPMLSAELAEMLSGVAD